MDPSENKQISDGKTANVEEIKISSKQSKTDDKAKATDQSPIASAAAAPSPTDIEELKRLFGLKTSLNRNAPKSDYELEKKEQWKFWETQPVPALGTSIPKDVNEPMEPNKDIAEINPNPFSLPAGFKWNDLDLENNDELMELYTLLNENYVEDDDNMFRFDYSPEFLKW